MKLERDLFPPANAAINRSQSASRESSGNPRDQIDFDPRAARQASGLGGRPRGLVIAEGFRVELVEHREVGHVGEVDRRLEDVLEGAAGGGEHRAEVREDLFGLRLETVIAADGTMITKTPDGWMTDREILSALADERVRGQGLTPRYRWLRRADRPEIRRPDQELVPFLTSSMAFETSGDTYTVRHILISTGVKDADNPNPMAREEPVKKYVERKLQEEKQKKLIEEIVAANHVTVPEDFNVPEVSEEQINEMMKQRQQPQLPEGLDEDTPPAANTAPASKKPAPAPKKTK